MVKKGLLAVIIAFVCFLTAGVAAIHFDTEGSNVLSLLRQDPPAEFYIHSQGNGDSNEIIFSDSKAIREFHDSLKDKTVKRQYGGKPAEDKTVLTMDYGYKGDTVFIDTEGRLFISEDAADIRNKSRLHWLWWKLDAGSKAHLIYATDPDAQVLEAAKNIILSVELHKQ